MSIAFEKGHYKLMWFLMHGDDLEFDDDWDPWVVGDSTYSYEETIHDEAPFWAWMREWVLDENGADFVSGMQDPGARFERAQGGAYRHRY